MGLEEDSAYQRRFHIFQRISWVVMALILMSAFIGLIGPGLMGPRSITSADSALVATFDTSTNYQKDSMLSIMVRDAPAGLVKIWLSRDYLD